MSKIVNSQYDTDLVYNIDCLVESKEYQAWRERLISQILSTVEVPGFRKGKAPEHLAIKQLNMMSVEETILQETISKFGTEALKESSEKLNEEKRIVQNQTIDLSEEFTGPVEGGFKFRIVLNLLPKVDLSPLENIKQPVVEAADFPQRVTKEEFVSRESSKFLGSLNEYTETENVAEKNYKIVVDVMEQLQDSEPKDMKDMTYLLGGSELPEEFETNLTGLKTGDEKEFTLKVPGKKPKAKSAEVKYKILVKQVLEPKYKNLEDLFAEVENARKQFESKDKFVDFLNNYYDQETDVITEDVKKRKIIQETIKVIPDFTLPLDRTEAEQNRILKVLQDQSATTGKSLAELFKESGISEDETKNVEDPIEIKKLIDIYVNREFKWIFILRNIYELKVEDKISSEQLDNVSREIQKQPEEYNVHKGHKDEYYKEIAYDRLMRSRATSWLFDMVLKGAENK